MTNIPPPPPSSPPPPPPSSPPPPPTGPGTVSYPPVPPPSGERGTSAGALAGLRGKLGNRTVPVIAGVGVAVVGGIVAIISLGGHGPTPHHKEGLTISTTPVTTPTPSTTPGTTPTTTPGTTPTTTPSTSPTTTPTTSPPAPSSSGGLTLGNNISVTPASGWTNNCSNCTNAVDLDSPDQTSDVFYGGNTAASSDATTELSSFIQAISQGSNATFSNFQTVGNVSTGNLSSNPGGFTSAAYVVFTATRSDSQGTQNFDGIVGVFLNAPAGYEVLESFESISEAGLQANLTDLNQMNNSIINS